MPKVTNLKPQVKNQQRISVYLDGQYSFSLTQAQLAESGLKVGAELKSTDLQRFQQDSELGKVEGKALRFLSYRPRSEWEVQQWFRRQSVEPKLADELMKRLRQWGYVDDQKFAESWISSRRALKSVSKTRLRQELQAKRVPSEIIDSALTGDEVSDSDALHQLIKIKRRQSRYRDDEKLMAYLARQGFRYDDIKAALDRD